MEEQTYVGLDVHRKTVVATAIDSLGKEIDQRTLGPLPEDTRLYLGSLPGEKHVAIEACSMWMPCFDAAEASGATAVLSNPYKTRIIAEATIKTDKVDSGHLAKLLRLDSLPLVYAPPPSIRALRTLVRERQFYSHRIRDLMNHAYSQLIHRAVPYEPGFLRLVHGRNEARRLNIPEVDMAMDMIDCLREKCRELDQRIHQEFLRSREAQLLETIPGIGELGAITLAAFICPIERFENVDKFSAYLGLVPSTRQSGDFRYDGKLRWDCNHLLQALVIELSWTHRMNERRGGVARYGARKGRQRGKNRGTVAAAHKLAKIIYAVLKRGTPYLPHAPERPAAMKMMRNPRVAATSTVRGTALESTAAGRLLAQ